MKHTYSILILALLILGSCNRKSQVSSVSIYQSEQQEFIYSIIRYAGRLVPRATHETKFNMEFDLEYWRMVHEHTLDFYYEDAKTDSIYFSLSRKAPSIHGHEVSIGGVLFKDSTGAIQYYEERFRTWKMDRETLITRTSRIFHDMINGRPLDRYYPENSGVAEYIEFPNRHVYFNTNERRWINQLEDPVQVLKEAQANR